MLISSMPYCSKNLGGVRKHKGFRKIIYVKNVFGSFVPFLFQIFVPSLR